MAQPKKGSRFLYNLEAVLKVRNIREIQEQEKFNEANRKLLEEKRKEKEIKDFQAQKYFELRQIMSEISTNVNQIMAHKVHLEIVAEKVIQQVKKREEAEEKKEEQRQKLIKAVKDKRIIETDKDKKRVAWRKLMDKEDSKFLDDIATAKFVHTSMEKAEMRAK